MTGLYRHVVVGGGGVAQYKHIPGYLNTGRAETLAVCDPSQEALGKVKERFPNIQTYTDLREMLDIEKPHLASVCTPNIFHRDIAVELMCRGIHVHLEKPIAMNAAEAEDIVRVKNETDTVVMLGLNNRFTNEACFVRDSIKTGWLGDIYYARCGWRRRRNIPNPGSWFTRKALSGGGPLIDLGVHMIDLSLHFMGYPKGSTVSASTYQKFKDCKSKNQKRGTFSGAGETDVEDLALGLIRLDNGASVSFEFSFALNTEKEEYFYELFGTKGGVSFNTGLLRVFSEINGTVVDIVPHTKYPKAEIDEFGHFLDVIEGKAELLSPPEEGYEMMRIIDGAYRSAELRKEVSLI